RTELLHQDICALQERVEPLSFGRVLQIQLDALLAAVEHGEIDALVTPARLVATHLVAPPGAFDLDDLGACLGQYQCGQRTRKQGREVEHDNALERLHSPLSSRLAATTALRAGA